jgi:hypothetical protein
MTNPYEKFNIRRPFLERIAPVAKWGWILALCIAALYCGFTQKDLQGRSEKLSAIILVAFILFGLWAVGILRRRKP